ncbi:MAG: mechanosensitive ion channel domain-containing protein [Bacteroidales bacterium]
MRLNICVIKMQYFHDPSIWLREIFLNAGLSFKLSSLMSVASLMLVVIFLSWLSNLIAKALIGSFVRRIARRTASVRDDIFVRQKVFTRLSHLVPAIVIWSLAGWAFKDYPEWLIVIRRLAYVYMLIIGAIVVNSFIEAWHRIYLTLPISTHRPIKGYVQVIKIIVVIFFSLLIYSVIFHQSVANILTGLGVLASVIILVFKDPILGLVASLQLSSNKMVKIGDWISIPGKNVDGEVADITLTTVKVKNFDKTIITVPTYSLVSEAFQNWAGMQQSGVRQIKRDFLVDVKSVTFADQALFDKIKGMKGFKEYFDISAPDGGIEIKGEKVNLYFSSGNLTNLGVFRMYAELYLWNHPLIDKNQTVIVRHRPIEGDGLPIQIYAFTSRNDFVTYENVQSEIFEHLFAVINDFGLKLFQQPSGHDVLSLSDLK